MRRIAKEKAGQPEGEVARKKLADLRGKPSKMPTGKLWINGEEVGVVEFSFHINIDITRFSQALNEAARQMRKMAEAMNK